MSIRSAREAPPSPKCARRSFCEMARAAPLRGSWAVEGSFAPAADRRWARRPHARGAEISGAPGPEREAAPRRSEVPAPGKHSERREAILREDRRGSLRHFGGRQVRQSGRRHARADSAARKDGKFTLHPTNPLDKFTKPAIGKGVKKFLDADRTAGRKYKVNKRPADDLSIQIPLIA
jgi:hypothetical protein